MWYPGFLEISDLPSNLWCEKEETILDLMEYGTTERSQQKAGLPRDRMSRIGTASFANMVIPLGTVGIVILAVHLPYRNVVKVCDSVFLEGFGWLLWWLCHCKCFSKAIALIRKSQNHQAVLLNQLGRVILFKSVIAYQTLKKWYVINTVVGFVP